MPARSGHLVRPLLGIDRETIRFYLGQFTEFAEDPTNDDLSFARNRIRHRLLSEMSGVNPAAVSNLVRTRAELAEDEDLFSRLVEEALAAEPPDPELGLRGENLRQRHPAVRRRILRAVAETALGRPVAVNMDLAAEAGRLLASPEGGRLDLGGGDSFAIEQGRIRVVPGGGEGGGEIPEPVGFDARTRTVGFGDWEVRIEATTEESARAGFGDPWTAYLDEKALLDLFAEASPGPEERPLMLRSWRSGDRIESLGMSGRKKLQDLFTDALVPASRRRQWPLLAVGDTVVWIPGLARSRHLLIGGPDRPVLRLQAVPPFPI